MNLNLKFKKIKKKKRIRKKLSICNIYFINITIAIN